MTETKEIEYMVRTTPRFRLKPKDGKRYQAINLKKQFGFMPDVIIVELLEGTKDILVVRAVLTDEEIAKGEEQSKILL